MGVGGTISWKSTCGSSPTFVNEIHPSPHLCTVHLCGGVTESTQVGFQLLRTLSSEVRGMFVLTKDRLGGRKHLGQDLRPSLRASQKQRFHSPLPCLSPD